MLTFEEVKDYKLFSGLEENELVKIANLCSRKTFESGSVIFSHDTPAEEIFLLEEGNDVVHIEVPISKKEKIIIHTLTEGEAFGWTALGKTHMRTATVRCTDKVSVICINGRSLIQLCEADYRIGYFVMKNLVELLSSRLSYTTITFRQELQKLKK